MTKKKSEWQLIGAINHNDKKWYIVQNKVSKELRKTTSIKKAIEYVGKF